MCTGGGGVCVLVVVVCVYWWWSCVCVCCLGMERPTKLAISGRVKRKQQGENLCFGEYFSKVGIKLYTINVFKFINEFK